MISTHRHRESQDEEMTMRTCRVLIAVLVVGLTGCAEYALEDSTRKWDLWLGTTKDDRVRELGIPTRCHAFRAGGEVCEWVVPVEGGRTETLGLNFDAKGTTCQWTYRGFYGDRRSQNSCP